MKTKMRQISYAVIAMVLMFAYFPNVASANPITPRKVTLGSSVASVNTTYDFLFTLPSTTTVKSIKFQACDQANTGGSCTQTTGANGFSSTAPGATLTTSTGLGSTGSWAKDASAANELRISNNSNTGSPGAAEVKFSTVHNPSTSNATFFIWITTYSANDYTTGPLDNGVVATSTAGLVTINANVDETLAFSLNTTTVSLGAGVSMTTGAASTGTASMSAATNAQNGYTINYTGATLTGPTAITALPAAANSSTGTKQFGMNMALNNGSPNIVSSAAPSGGSGTATSGSYDQANKYRFNTSGEAIAAATGPTNATTYVVSYMANIDATTPAGAYTTAIIYTATANF